MCSVHHSWQWGVFKIVDLHDCRVVTVQKAKGGAIKLLDHDGSGLNFVDLLIEDSKEFFVHHSLNSSDGTFW